MRWTGRKFSHEAQPVWRNERVSDFWSMETWGGKQCQEETDLREARDRVPTQSLMGAHRTWAGATHGLGTKKDFWAITVFEIICIEKYTLGSNNNLYLVKYWPIICVFISRFLPRV